VCGGGGGSQTCVKVRRLAESSETTLYLKCRGERSREISVSQFPRGRPAYVPGLQVGAPGRSQRRSLRLSGRDRATTLA
jgi:hypothetical protein